MFGAFGFGEPRDNQNQEEPNQGTHAREDPRPTCGKGKEAQKGKDKGKGKEAQKGKDKDKGKEGPKGQGKGKLHSVGDRLVQLQVKNCYEKKERAAYQTAQAMRASLNSLRLACEEADETMETNVLNILESFPRSEREALEQRQIDKVTCCTDENHRLLSATIYDAKYASQADHEAYLNDKYSKGGVDQNEDSE